jgi:hypothetical protein
MARRKKVSPSPCVWRMDEDGVWLGTCGVLWCLEEGTPKDHEMRFCPRCGHPMKQGPPQ